MTTSPTNESGSTAAPAGEARRYSRVAQTLHWIIAVLILLNLLLGWRMGHMHGLTRFQVFQLHKSFGITVLVLSVARLGWRLTHPAPLLNSIRPVERAAAHATHVAFYGFMVLLALLEPEVLRADPFHRPPDRLPRHWCGLDQASGP